MIKILCFVCNLEGKDESRLFKCERVNKIPKWLIWKYDMLVSMEMKGAQLDNYKIKLITNISESAFLKMSYDNVWCKRKEMIIAGHYPRETNMRYANRKERGVHSINW